jgi:hypothetical protein
MVVVCSAWLFCQVESLIYPNGERRERSLNGEIALKALKGSASS